jgi:hypothetical protein
MKNFDSVINLIVVVYICFFPSEIFQPSIENLAQQASPSVEWKKPTLRLLPARNVEGGRP